MPFFLSAIFKYCRHTRPAEQGQCWIGHELGKYLCIYIFVSQSLYRCLCSRTNGMKRGKCLRIEDVDRRWDEIEEIPLYSVHRYVCIIASGELSICQCLSNKEGSCWYVQIFSRHCAHHTLLWQLRCLTSGETNVHIFIDLSTYYSKTRCLSVCLFDMDLSDFCTMTARHSWVWNFLLYGLEWFERRLYKCVEV